MRSGLLNPNDGKSWRIGFDGRYWSTREASMRDDGADMPSAYYLYFSTGVYASNGPTNQSNGFPLRCLSTVLEYVETVC